MISRRLAVGLALAAVAGAYTIVSWKRLPSDVIRGPAKVVALLGGGCAIWDRGAMQCWGPTTYSSYGEYARRLWLSDEKPWARPSPRAPVRDVIAPSYVQWRGRDSVCALLPDETLECTGIEVGNSLERSFVPPLRSPPELGAVRSPVVSASRVCVIASESVWCATRVGAPKRNDEPTTEGWARVPLGAPTSIAMTARELCAMYPSGRVQCLDINLGETHDIDGVASGTQLVTGEEFACVRERDGVVRCWGQNDVGQLGDGGSWSRPHEARLVALVGPVTDLAAFGKTACALRDGVPWCWGELRSWNSLPPIWKRVPDVAAEVSGLSSISVSAGFACGTRAVDRTVWCWGNDSGGRLGNGAVLPHHGCSREGISGASPEHEWLQPPTPVRTGEAGMYPRARLVAPWIALLLATPLLFVRATWQHWRPNRSLRTFAALLVALFIPMLVSRLLNLAIVLYDRTCAQGEECYLRWSHAEYPLKVGVPLLVSFAALIYGFRSLGAATDVQRAGARSRAAIVMVAVPSLALSMLFTHFVKDDTRVAVAYMLRDANLEEHLSWPFALQFWWSVGWIVLAALFGLTAPRDDGRPARRGTETYRGDQRST